MSGETDVEARRVRAYRAMRLYEPSMEGYNAAVAVYEAAFGETDGNQAATQSSGDNRGSEAQEKHTPTFDFSPPCGSVEQQREAVLDLMVEFNTSGERHAPSPRERLDALIAAVRAEGEAEITHAQEILCEAIERRFAELIPHSLEHYAGKLAKNTLRRTIEQLMSLPPQHTPDHPKGSDTLPGE